MQDFFGSERRSDGYLVAAERLGVPISKCLVFEDSDIGIIDAATVGATSIMFPELQSPSAAVQNLAALVVKSIVYILNAIAAPLMSDSPTA